MYWKLQPKATPKIQTTNHTIGVELAVSKVPNIIIDVIGLKQDVNKFLNFY